MSLEQDGGLFGKKKDKEEKKDDKGKEDPDKGKEGDGGLNKGSSTDPDKGESSNDCPEGQKICIVSGLAKKIIEKGNVIDAAKEQIVNSVTNKVASIKNTIIEDIKNPVKCAADVIVGLPTAVENFLNGIANGLNNIGNAAENALEKSATMVFENPFAPFEVFFYGKIKNFQLFFANILLGAKGKEILLDPNMSPEKILQAMLKLSESFTKIFDHPMFQKIFNKWLTNYAAVLDKGINMAMVPLTGVTDKLTGIVTDTTKRVGDAIGASLTNIIDSILKSIPFVGVVFNVGSLAKKIAGKIMAICEPFIAKGGLAVSTVANIGYNEYNKAKCQVNSLKKKIDPILKTINSAAGTNQAGGSFSEMSIERKRKKMHKATKRVQRMLLKFTRRQNKPTNYAKRLLKFRLEG